MRKHHRIAHDIFHKEMKDTAKHNGKTAFCYT